MDLKSEAKKEVLRSLISKMRMMMTEEAPEGEEMEGEEPMEGMPGMPEMEGEEMEDENPLEPEAVKSFMKKTNKKPVGKHSLLIASMGVKPMGAPAKKPFQKK